MNQIVRTDKSIVGRWWWSVDRWALGALLVLAGLGIVLVTAASPAVAEGHGLPPFFFVYRHLAFLAPSLLLMFSVSMLNRKMLWRVASVTLLASMFLMLVAIFFGMEIKGATRWVHFLGNHWVDIDGDRASGEAYTMACHLRRTGAAQEEEVALIRYRDFYRRTDDGWRFTERHAFRQWTTTRPINAARHEIDLALHGR